jgi:hypothetical protein
MLGLTYFRSNTVYFSYDPPVVQKILPWPVWTDGVAATSLSLWGKNFGPPDVSDDRISVSTSAIRLRGFLVLMDGQIVVRATGAALPAGWHNISFQIAEQEGFNPATPSLSSLLVLCKKDFFGRQGESCLPCPIGAVCAGGAVLTTSLDAIHGYPEPISGFFNLNSSVNASLSQCPDSVRSASLNRDVCIVACIPKDACLGNNTCSTGYESRPPFFRCGSCSRNYYRSANDCIECPNAAPLLIVGAVIIFMVAGGIAFYFNRKRINLGFIAQAVDFFQVLSIFANSKVPWPPVLKRFFKILSAFNFNIEVVAPECLIPDISYKSKWIFIVCAPLVIAAMFLTVYAVQLAYKRIFKGRSGARLQSHAGGLVSTFLMICYMLYLYEVRTTLEVLSCSPAEPPEYNSRGKPVLYMLAASEPCSLPGGAHMTLLPWAGLAFAVYGMGYPLFVFFVLCRRKNRERIMEDQLLRAHGKGDDKLTNPRGYEIRKHYRNLYYQFKPESFFWMLCILGRKFFLAVTFIIFSRNGPFQLALALLVLFFAFAAQVRWKPYMSPSDHRFVLLEFQSGKTAQHVRLQERVAHAMRLGRKSVFSNSVQAEAPSTGPPSLRILVASLFKYNTAEAFLLFCCVMVCLMGLMFNAQSARSFFYGDARDTSTGIALAFGIMGVLYIITCIMLEARAACNRHPEESMIQRRKSQRGMWDDYERKKAETVNGTSQSAPANEGFLKRMSGRLSARIMEALTSEADLEVQAAEQRRKSYIAPTVQTEINEAAADPLSAVGLSVAVQSSFLSLDEPPAVSTWEAFKRSFLAIEEEHARVLEGLSAANRTLSGEWHREGLDDNRDSLRIRRAQFKFETNASMPNAVESKPDLAVLWYDRSIADKSNKTTTTSSGKTHASGTNPAFGESNKYHVDVANTFRGALQPRPPNQKPTPVMGTQASIKSKGDVSKASHKPSNIIPPASFSPLSPTARAKKYDYTPSLGSDGAFFAENVLGKKR